jgi:Ca2+-binding RTX toxin-like protein
MSFAGPVAPATGEAPFWFLRAPAEGGAGFVGAWSLALGRGVTLGMLDTGVNGGHADFLPGMTATLGAAAITDPHGTRTAGLVAGRIDNAIGALGVATGASLTSVMMNFAVQPSVSATAAALTGQAAFDVSNNSWGWSRAFADNFLTTAFRPVAEAILTGAAEGRGGLGTVWVFAGGNGRLMRSGENHGDDSNFHNLTNARQTIAVGATDPNGRVAAFSSPGANLLLVAPGQSLATTDGLTAGATGRAFASGTSFAAPLVSGTVAMMLDVAPHLGYRDIQEILAITAQPVATAPGTANAGNAVNGGGLVFSRDAGFGLLDAEAAVRLARHHAGGGTAATERGLAAPLLAAPDDDPAQRRLAATVAPGDDGLRVEWAELRLTVTDPSLRTLSVLLVSPGGTSVVIAPNLSIVAGATRLDFTFTSAATRGEDAAGDWTVILRQAEGTGETVIEAAELRLFGAAGGDDGMRYFTDAWSRLAADDPGRAAIGHDAAGPGTLNFAPVRGAVTVDLGAGTGRLDGRDFTLTAPFAAVIGGAGRDRLTGSAAGDTLNGDDGNDTLAGGDGDDLLLGGAGDDVLQGGRGSDRLFGGAGNDVLNGGAGHDHLEGGAGDDRLTGGAGNDTLIGGPGRDVMTGGPGADVFVFRPGDAPETGRDRIADFDPSEDRIALLGFDMPLAFIGGAAFTGTAGELRYLHRQQRLLADLDGDGRADFEIAVDGGVPQADSFLFF